MMQTSQNGWCVTFSWTYFIALFLSLINTARTVSNFWRKEKKKSKTQDILWKKTIEAKRINTRFLKYAGKQMKPTWQNGSKTHITSIKVELPEECLACHSKEEKKVYINLSIIHITLGYWHQKAAFRDSAADCHFLTLLPGRFA